MQTQLRTRLLADSTISAAVGTRVDWNIRPQGKPLPAITLLIPADSRDQTMSGLQATRGPEVQIDVWANGDAAGIAQAATIREAIVTLLATPAVQGGVTFLASQNIVTSGTVERTETGMVARELIRANVWHTT